MAKTPNYNWTTYEDGVTVINFQTDISNFIKDVDTKFKQQADAIAANATNIGLLNGPIPVTWISGDPTWNYKPTGRYYIGGDGVALGSQRLTLSSTIWSMKTTRLLKA